MAYRLMHHDLIRVDVGMREPGIYWLRLFEDLVPNWVAIVTEVPGNPSTGVTNAISRIVEHLVEHFYVEIPRLSLYRVWPRGSQGDIGIMRVRVGDPHTTFHHASWAEVKRRLAQDIPNLPAHPKLYQRVLDFGGGRTRPIYREVFEAVRTSELPPPHAPFQCAWSERFDSILASSKNPKEAGVRFLDSLSAGDRAQCRYHQQDWKAIADESVRILHELGPAQTAAYLSVAHRAGLNVEDQNALESLFRDPIVVGEEEYVNGQHRGCAVRFSGAERVAVIVDEVLDREEPDVWVYRGGG
jgi:hypothetical protein